MTYLHQLLKYFICLTLVLLPLFLLAQQDSDITSVIVYLDGAEISRTANITLPEGKSELKFHKLSPYIAESSIQVSGLGDASVLSISYGINYLNKRKQKDSIDILTSRIKNIEHKIHRSYTEIDGFVEELSLMQSNKRLGNETETVSLEKLKTFASYIRERTTSLKAQKKESELKIEEYESEIKDIKLQLKEFNVDEKEETGEIVLKLHSNQTTTLKLGLSYNVNHAGWFPIYDLKAESIDSPLELQYKAHVFQNTGEDWTDINLILSTSDPNTNNIKPVLSPKYLNFISRYSTYNSNRPTKSYNYKYNPLVKTVSGTITSASDGLPLPGASIIESGTTNGTQSDFDGNYSLTTNGGNELVYSYLGYDTETLPIHSSIMNVSMNEHFQNLDEVVVTGYATKRSHAVSSVSSESIERKTESFTRALAGQIAGLNITSSSGQPGNASVMLRGVSSINHNSEPLFIIDGVPISNPNFENIVPEDIATIDVLKNEAATSIYGSRASNGVVVIQTKKNTNSLGHIVSQGITNTRFEIDKPYSIPTDGDVTVIEIDKFSVPAKYQYFTAPIVNENVFLTATIGNWEQYNLLPAEANIYFEGSYSGKTNINPAATSDSLTVSLGVDPNIVVKRTQLNNFKKTTFIGSNKVIYNGFDLDIKNNKSTAINLKLVDRIPKSQNKEIKIDDIAHDADVYDEEKGLLEWNLSLKPAEKTKNHFSYSVRFPKYKRVNL